MFSSLVQLPAECGSSLQPSCDGISHPHPEPAGRSAPNTQPPRMAALTWEEGCLVYLTSLRSYPDGIRIHFIDMDLENQRKWLSTSLFSKRANNLLSGRSLSRDLRCLLGVGLGTHLPKQGSPSGSLQTSSCVCVCACIHRHTYRCMYTCTYTERHSYTHMYTYIRISLVAQIESACNVGDSDSIPGLGSSPGEGSSIPFQ